MPDAAPEPANLVDAGAGPTAPPAGKPAPKPGNRERCPPGAGLRCHTGDVWSLDGCGQLEAKVQECGDTRCRDAACAPVAQRHCDEPAEGRCDGKSVVFCFAGQVQRVDCAAQGLTCALGEEGAECVAPVAPSESCAGAPHCDGQVLTLCEEGRKRRIDCTAQRARCLTVPGASYPTCVALTAPALELRKCGPCGCPPAKGDSEQECDNQDEDGDRYIDEGLDCGALPVVAFVVTDARGESSYAQEDVELELARINQYFREAGEEPGLSVELDAIVPLADPDLLSMDGEEVGKLASDPRVHPAREEFYIPLVFTDQVIAGGSTPKLGVSTLPNATCGGMQDGTGPELGIVALSKSRAPTTAAHEIGHYLGLCHTHDQRVGRPLRAVTGERGETVMCDPACSAEGDGVCDTPLDPGPPMCSYDPECETDCRGGAQPDALNVMSYYTECRARFSAEQIRLVQHTLALRRGWYPCTGGRCSCELGGAQCPAGMSCRFLSMDGKGPVRRCTLDGPFAPGAECQNPAQCGANALCLQTSQGTGRCVRACQVSSDGCECVPANELVKVCKNDLG